MPKEVKITCDGCGRDLTVTGNCVDYRLMLVAENIPADTHYPVTAMMVYPPITGSRYFCGLSCLEGWLTQRASDLGYCDCPIEKRAYFNGVCKSCGKLRPSG